MEAPFAAVDVHYPAAGGANAAMVMARDLAFSVVVGEYTVALDDVAAYRPGHFYERELPAIRAVLAGQEAVGLVVVDGYVHLDPTGRAGRAAYDLLDAWDALVREFPGMAGYSTVISCAVNEEYARLTAALQDGDEIAFLPPVSGG